VGELQHQIDVMSGQPGAGGTFDFPTIRQLPLLGVKYADLYRRTKIEETVFELLTQQYELAKVQEARSTPSVKVLDNANIPERKAFPPRALIVLASLFISALFATTFVLLRRKWMLMDPQQPAKLLVEDILGTVRLGRCRRPSHSSSEVFR